MEYTRKVGIMGGTFNPIHTGHLILAETALSEFALDEILFIPNGNAYMKDITEILDSDTRITLTSAAIEDNSHFALSTIEIEREGASYSYQTLEELKQANPTTEYYFIVGADSLSHMIKWRHPEKLFKQCIVLAAARNGCEMQGLQELAAELAERYQADIRILSQRNIDISSTDIRQRISDGKSIRYLVPDKVIAYINKFKLYQQMPDTGDR